MIEKRKLCVFDFDGTLINTPEGSDEDKQKWADFYGKPEWPYLGWWGRDESLDTKVWDMKPLPEVQKAYNVAKSDPSNMVIMLTGRITKQGHLVKKILDSHGFDFDSYNYKRGGDTLTDKLRTLTHILKTNPTIKDIEMWDDRVEHFGTFEEWGERLKDLGRIDSFYLNKVG